MVDTKYSALKKKHRDVAGRLHELERVFDLIVSRQRWVFSETSTSEGVVYLSIKLTREELNMVLRSHPESLRQFFMERLSDELTRCAKEIATREN